MLLGDMAGCLFPHVITCLCVFVVHIAGKAVENQSSYPKLNASFVEELEKCSGFVYSPNFPEPYSSETVSYYLIEAPERHHIILKVSFLDLELSSHCQKDGIVIYDGSDTSSTVLATLCGSSNSGSQEYVTTYNKAFVKFYTDSNVNGDGFLLGFNAVPDDGEPHSSCAVATLPPTGCDGNVLYFREPSGQIKLPTFPTSYGNSMDCIFTIDISSFSNSFTLNWLSLDLEHQSACLTDRVKLYNPVTKTSKGPYCGDELPESEVIPGGLVYVIFHSDGANDKQGFSLQYMADGFTTVPEKIQQSSTVSSTEAPSERSELLELIINIMTQLLSLTSFSNRSTSLMSRATANSSSAPEVATISIKATVQTTLLNTLPSTTTVPTIENGQTTTATKPVSRNIPTYFMKSSDNLNIEGLDEGYILSPDFPNLYPNRVNAEVHFKFDVSKRLEIFVEDFEVESNAEGTKCWDQLFFEGSSINYKYGYYCGSIDSVPKHFWIEGPEVRMVFQTDQTNPKSGFKIRFMITDPSPPESVSPYICGKPFVKPCLPALTADPSCSAPKIVGGQEARPHSYPWQVAITTSDGRQFCGGTIIHPEWILTAAHCVENDSPSNIMVLPGAHVLDDRNTGESSARRQRIIDIRVHPKFSSYTFDYDIALLKLQNPLKFGKRISPACLISKDYSYDAGQQVVVTGWGTLFSQGPHSPSLQEVQLSIVSDAVCNASYKDSITSRMVCTREKGKDACQGDSGGPMVVKDSDIYKLAGVVSWGEGCADSLYPGVFTRLTSFYDWISKYVSNI